jgi:hypothetical protein
MKKFLLLLKKAILFLFNLILSGLTLAALGFMGYILKDQVYKSLSMNEIITQMITAAILLIFWAIIMCLHDYIKGKDNGYPCKIALVITAISMFPVIFNLEITVILYSALIILYAIDILIPDKQKTS